MELKLYEKILASAIKKVMTAAITVRIRNMWSVNFNGLILNFDMDLLEVVEAFNNFLYGVLLITSEIHSQGFCCLIAELNLIAIILANLAGYGLEWLIVKHYDLRSFLFDWCD